MPRTKETLSPGYQYRLQKILDQVRQRGDKQISLNALARELGNKSLVARFSLWANTTLKSPVGDDNFDLLSKADPRERSAEEIKQWVESGEELPPIEPLQSSIESLDIVRVFMSLMSGNKPVHQMIEQVLSRHGHTLNDDGIEFFVAHSSATRENRKLLIKRYLKGLDVDADALNTTYPCIATGINRLSGLYVQVNGDELQWLDCVEQRSNKASAQCKA